MAARTSIAQACCVADAERGQTQTAATRRWKVVASGLIAAGLFAAPGSPGPAHAAKAPEAAASQPAKAVVVVARPEGAPARFRQDKVFA